MSNNNEVCKESVLHGVKNPYRSANLKTDEENRIENESLFWSY